MIVDLLVSQVTLSLDQEDHERFHSLPEAQPGTRKTTRTKNGNVGRKEEFSHWGLNQIHQDLEAEGEGEEEIVVEAEEAVGKCVFPFLCEFPLTSSGLAWSGPLDYGDDKHCKFHEASSRVGASIFYELIGFCCFLFLFSSYLSYGIVFFWKVLYSPSSPSYSAVILNFHTCI